MALSNKWFSGVRPEDKQTRDETVRNARFVLDILTEIIEQDLKELDTCRSEDYETASWSHKQADRNGQRRALMNLLKLTRDR